MSTTSTTDATTRRGSKTSPSDEAVLRILNDARVWVNVARDGGLSFGAGVPLDEVIKQLREEGYVSKREARDADGGYTKDELIWMLEDAATVEVDDDEVMPAFGGAT